MTDYLTSLPTELLQYICKLVQASHRNPYLGLVSKAFLPFARSRRFAEFTIYSFNRLAKLVELAEGSPGAVAVAKKCTLSLATDADGGSPSSKAVLNCLGKMKSLETLIIRHSTRLAKAVLSEAKMPHLFSSLVSLNITDPLHGWSNPWAPSHYINLSRHKNLRHLELDITRTRESLGRYRSAPEIPVFPSRWQFALSLKGHVTKNPAAERLLLSFSEIHYLCVEDPSPEAQDDFPSFLRFILYRDTLTTLVLSMKLSQSTLNILAIALPFFKRLEDLGFEHGSYGPALLPAFRSLPDLNTLAFWADSAITASDLKALISGPEQLAKLNRIWLCNLKLNPVWCEVHFDECWIPHWTAGLTRDGMEEILDLADERGVQLFGEISRWTRKTREERRAAVMAQKEE